MVMVVRSGSLNITAQSTDMIDAPSDRHSSALARRFDRRAGLVFSGPPLANRVDDLIRFVELNERGAVIADRAAEIGERRALTLLPPLPQRAHGLANEAGGLVLAHPLVIRRCAAHGNLSPVVRREMQQFAAFENPSE